MKFVSFLLFVIGLGLLAGAVWLWRDHVNFAAHAVHADGVITRMIYRSSSRGGGSYFPEVQFNAPDGRVVHFTGAVSSHSGDRGEHVAVIYPPNNPQDARIDSFMENWFGSLVLGGMGLVFALMGAGTTVGRLLKRGPNRWLAASGMRVQAKYEGVESGNLQVGGRDSYRLKCQWQHPVNQAVYLFHSARIWYDPSPFVKRDTLDVLVDMDKPKRYEVDISFLPKAG